MVSVSGILQATHVTRQDTFEAASRQDTCGSAAGAAVLVVRGACSFAEKAAVLSAANASLAIVYNTEPGARHTFAD